MSISQPAVAPLIIDPCWGEGGWSELPLIPGLDPERHIAGIAVQSDQRVLACASTADREQTRYAIYRFDATGMLDATFGSRGWITGNLLDDANGISGAQDIATFFDSASGTEKIVMLGWRQRYASADRRTELMVARFNLSGALDGTFAYHGRVLLPPCGDADRFVLASAKLCCQGSRIHACVNIQSRLGDHAYARIYRLHVDGRLDQELGINGVVEVRHGNDQLCVHSLVCVKGGKILLTGTLTHPDNCCSGFRARLASSGEPDPTFGDNGFIVHQAEITPATDGTFDEPPIDRQRQADGALLLAFGVQRPAGPSGAIVRLVSANDAQKRKSLMGRIRLFLSRWR